MFDLVPAACSVARMHTFGLGETSGDHAMRMNAINLQMHRALCSRAELARSSGRISSTDQREARSHSSKHLAREYLLRFH